MQRGCTTPPSLTLSTRPHPHSLVPRLYEQVRTERSTFSKNLIEAQDEMAEMKRKLKIMNHQVEQLKEEVTSKESSMVKERAAFEEVEQHKTKLKADLDKLKVQYEKHQKFIQNQQAESEKLKHIVAEAEAEQARLRKELETVISERDILSTQLVRRNDELALVYEKIRIQQSTLNKGELQYQSRLDDIRLLKAELKRLAREKTVLSKTVSNVDEVKVDLHRAQRDLLREKLRARALEEELETPMNIHRWRKLQGSDPHAFEMVQKIQTLQKRLIAKTEEVVDKEIQIQEREKQFVELKVRAALAVCPVHVTFWGF